MCSDLTEIISLQRISLVEQVEQCYSPRVWLESQVMLSISVSLLVSEDVVDETKCQSLMESFLYLSTREHGHQRN